MKSSAQISFLLLSCYLINPVMAVAEEKPYPTHEGKLEVALDYEIKRGKLKTVEESTGDVRINWRNSSCEFEVAGHFYPCQLDRSQNMETSSGEVIIQEMPQIYFEGKTLALMAKHLGARSDRSKHGISRAVDQTASERTDGFRIPTYTCQNCDDGAGRLIWSVFEKTRSSYVEREIQVARYPKAVLKFKLRDVKANAGVLHIIGNNRDGNL